MAKHSARYCRSLETAVDGKQECQHHRSLQAFKCCVVVTCPVQEVAQLPAVHLQMQLPCTLIWDLHAGPCPGQLHKQRTLVA